MTAASFSHAQTSCPTTNRLYVDEAATGTNDGSSWTNAFVELRDALSAPCPDVTEIWVAAGIYKPSPDRDQFSTFTLRNGLAIYGGFVGGETALSQRDFTVNVTELDGDNASFNVVTGDGTDATAVVDGFTIKRGVADTIDPDGAGMVNHAGSPTIRNVIFTENVGIKGGAIANFQGSNPLLENVVFYDNLGASGGAMYNHESSPCLINVVFDRNVSQYTGGNILNDSGSNATFVNCTITGGFSFNVGGVAVSASAPTFVNTIIWDNDAADVAIFNAATPNFSHCLIDGSGGSIAWNSLFGIDGGDNIDADPIFVDAANGDLRLTDNSPAANSGDNSAAKLPAEDLDGKDRIIAGVVDMGAYESGTQTGGDFVIVRSRIRTNYPNPFNPETTISFELVEAGYVDLQIYSVSGRVVRTLLGEPRDAGPHAKKWDGRTDGGDRAASGVYFAVMRTGATRDQRKITLLR